MKSLWPKASQRGVSNFLFINIQSNSLSIMKKVLWYFCSSLLEKYQSAPSENSICLLCSYQWLRLRRARQRETRRWRWYRLLPQKAGHLARTVPGMNKIPVAKVSANQGEGVQSYFGCRVDDITGVKVTTLMTALWTLPIHASEPFVKKKRKC